jgi:hypothetical protein
MPSFLSLWPPERLGRRVPGKTSSIAFQKPRAVADGEVRCNREFSIPLNFPRK